METQLDRTSKLAKTQISKLRWALGLQGVLSVVVGIVILVWPDISLVALTILVGAYAFATGIIELGVAFTDEGKSQRGWYIVSGLLGIALGIVVLAWPNISSLALLYVVGVYAIMIGLLGIYASFALPLDGRDTALMILASLVSILFGVVMFAKPGTGALAMLAVIAAFLLVTGISQLVLAIGGKQLVEHRLKKLSAQQTQQTQKRTPQPSH